MVAILTRIIFFRYDNEALPRIDELENANMKFMLKNMLKNMVRTVTASRSWVQRALQGCRGRLDSRQGGALRLSLITSLTNINP